MVKVSLEYEPEDHEDEEIVMTILKAREYKNLLEHVVRLLVTAINSRDEDWMIDGGEEYLNQVLEEIVGSGVLDL